MEFIRQYAVSIITVSVLSVIFEIILPPKRYGKYISVITGLICMMVILSPVRQLFGDFEMFVIEGNALQSEIKNEADFNLVASEFKKRLEEKIEQTAKIKTGEEIKAQVELELTEKGEILNIKEAKIFPYSEKCAKIIKDEFDITVNYGSEEEQNGN